MVRHINIVQSKMLLCMVQLFSTMNNTWCLRFRLYSIHTCNLVWSLMSPRICLTIKQLWNSNPITVCFNLQFCADCKRFLKNFSSVFHWLTGETSARLTKQTLETFVVNSPNTSLLHEIRSLTNCWKMFFVGKI